MKWMPIETAPKDGSVFLVKLHPDIAKKSGFEMEICRYEKRPLLGETLTAQNEGFSTGIDGGVGWMPLPDYSE